MFWKNKKINTVKENLKTESNEKHSSDLTLKREIRHSKFIVGGKLYDTEKSECLCCLEDGRVLFRTPKGNYFSCEVGNESYKDEEYSVYVIFHYDIRPESIENVKEIIGKYDVDKYIELFGEPEEA